MLCEDKRPLASVSPNDSLLLAVQRLYLAKVHRLLVINPDNGNPLHVLTYKRILRFVHTCVSTIPHVFGLFLFGTSNKVLVPLSVFPLPKPSTKQYKVGTIPICSWCRDRAFLISNYQLLSDHASMDATDVKPLILIVIVIVNNAICGITLFVGFYYCYRDV